MTARRGFVAVVLVVVAAVVGSGCGSDGYGDADGDPGAAAAAAGAAVAVCGLLVDFDHTVADAVNVASRQITQVTEPAEARRLLLEATDEVQAAVDDLPDRYVALALGDEGDIARLVADASANAETVSAQLDLIRSELTDGLDGEDAVAILTATFINYEKVQSLAQPNQGDYDDDALVEALDTDPACEHTISR